jgi:hypothetical protein
LPRLVPNPDVIGPEAGARKSLVFAGQTMAKHTDKSTPKEIEERFLLQSLRRLRNPNQRYVFTMIADLISLGLAVSKNENPKLPPRP